MSRLLGVAALVAVVASTALAPGATARSSATRPLTIYAAASLAEVFKTLDPGQHYSFAGSNALLYPRLGDFAVFRLTDGGEEVRISDYFDEGWKSK